MKKITTAALAMVMTGILLAALAVSGCSEIIRDERDELVMSSWSKKLDPSDTVIRLSFSGDDACLDICGDGVSRKIEGLCALSIGEFAICDRNTKTNYVFSYTLRGDCLELVYNGSSLTLDKEEQ